MELLMILRNRKYYVIFIMIFIVSCKLLQPRKKGWGDKKMEKSDTVNNFAWPISVKEDTLKKNKIWGYVLKRNLVSIDTFETYNNGQSIIYNYTFQINVHCDTIRLEIPSCNKEKQLSSDSFEFSINKSAQNVKIRYFNVWEQTSSTVNEIKTIDKSFFIKRCDN